MPEFCSPKYIIRDGLRHIEPYFHSLYTTAKHRWFGKKVLQVFTNEFNRSEQYYRNAISSENLYLVRDSNSKVNKRVYRGSSVLELSIKQGDIIYNKFHKHEPPVSTGGETYLTNSSTSYYSKYYQHCCSIQIVDENESFFVINKPSGVPVHPSGKYYYNSITEILKHELNMTSQIYTCHRLDKLTSGLVIFAKDPNLAKILSDKFRFKNIKKQYLSRVTGKFPDEIVCRDPVFLLNPGHKSTGTDHNVQLKTATTYFKRLKYDSIKNESIVQCEPLTGRTHQIRIHLRNLNHPIVNDPSYGPQSVSPMKNQVELDLINEFKKGKNFEELHNEKQDMYLVIKDEIYQQLHTEFCNRVAHYKNDGRVCEVCGEELFNQIADASALMIYLHAFNYKLYDHETKEKLWEYETEMPKWAYIN